MLGVIAKVREMSLEVELRYKDVQERYRTLAMYSIKVRVMLCMYSTYICRCVCTIYAAYVRILAPKLCNMLLYYVHTYVHSAFV